MFESLQPAFYGISFTFFALTLATCVLRLYSRAFILREFGWDDGFMLAVTIAILVQQAIYTLFIVYGGGLHMTAGGAALFPKMLYVLYVIGPFYVFLHFIVKMSFLAFYHRLIPRRGFRRVVWGAIILNFVLFIIPFTIYLAQCIPVNAFFHPAEYPGVVCIGKKPIFYIPVTFSIFMDFVILCLPIHPLSTLQMSIKRRIQLFALFSFGGISVLIALVRLFVIHQFANSADLSYVLGKMVIISAVEIYVGIMAANVPGMKAFWSTQISKSALQGSNSSPYSHELVDTAPKMKIPSTSNSLIPDAEGVMDGRHTGREWRGDASEEELVERKPATLGRPEKNARIKVTSTVDVESSTDLSSGVWNEQYNRFGDEERDKI